MAIGAAIERRVFDGVGDFRLRPTVTWMAGFRARFFATFAFVFLLIWRNHAGGGGWIHVGGIFIAGCVRGVLFRFSFPGDHGGKSDQGPDNRFRSEGIDIFRLFLAQGPLEIFEDFTGRPVHTNYYAQYEKKYKQKMCRLLQQYQLFTKSSIFLASND